MKKTLILILVILTLIILISTSCNKKTYVITATNYWKEPSYYKYLSDDVAVVLRKTEEGTDSINSYSARSIISFTDKSIRFIDNTGKEQFITADNISVK